MAASSASSEQRDGVSLTNLDQPLFDGADATKRDLVDYLDAMSDRIIPVLTVAAAYSPRIRAGTLVSFPVAWEELDKVVPAEFTLHTAVNLANDRDPWAELMPAAKPLPASLIEEGNTIPIARVQAMHEGKRRARDRRAT
jgi:DNA primase